jgi:hypothetical protein
LASIGGTWQYLAPEVYEEHDRTKSDRHKKGSYTPAADVRSLGVVVFHCVCDLPHDKDEAAVWGGKIIKDLKDLAKRLEVLKRFLLAPIVIEEPKLRVSAADCYNRARCFSPIQPEDRC